jgi:hypothetical protein
LGDPPKPGAHVAVHTLPACAVGGQLKVPLVGFGVGAVAHTMAARMHKRTTRQEHQASTPGAQCQARDGKHINVKLDVAK